MVLTGQSLMLFITGDLLYYTKILFLGYGVVHVLLIGTSVFFLEFVEPEKVGLTNMIYLKLFYEFVSCIFSPIWVPMIAYVIDSGSKSLSNAR